MECTVISLRRIDEGFEPLCYVPCRFADAVSINDPICFHLVEKPSNRRQARQGHDNQFNSILNEFVQCDGDTTRARFYCEMF